MSIIADNFPSEEYEFITSEYMDQIDYDFYYGFSTKLVICCYCNIIVAVYNEPNQSVLYDAYWKEENNCKNGFCSLNRPTSSCIHCIHCRKWR